ncbi:MAG: hypothetical protein HQM08_01920 [Candidatus Riflebacteria bacterium]|nr:hypothetical protein [Candidatus Riflebacteria bacterium]
MEFRFFAVVSLLLLVCLNVRANELGIEEDFALSGERESVLKKLVPGTEEYYYYHCIQFQNSGNLSKCAEMLKQWIDRYGYTPKVTETQNRLMLLRYPENKSETLGYLKEKLNLTFNHSRILMNQKPTFQTRLDQSILSKENFIRIAFSISRDFSQFEESGLYTFTDSDKDPDQRRFFLRRLTRPVIDNLPTLVTRDLAYERSGTFGTVPIHYKLTREQLEKCLELMPKLLNETNFINCYISKLWPGADKNGIENHADRSAYLNKLWEFVKKLPISHNSLKAHVLYHKLKDDMERNEYDKNMFVEYLKLPRNGYYINQEFLNRRENQYNRADLSFDFKSQTLLPSVGNDESLVRQYLRNLFLSESENESGITNGLKKLFDFSGKKQGYSRLFDELSELIEFNYLNDVFAETRLTAGTGDMEKWFSLLTPEKVREIRERVELEFPPHNPDYFKVSDPVSLEVSIKNVPTLIVKVFRLNTMNYYRESNQEINTAIDLDGLFPNEENVYKYDLPEFKRHSEKFNFNSLSEPGTYVIEFIGGGKSCRALIRKGRLSFTERVGSAGQVFKVFDEAGNLVKNAEVFLSGHLYKAEENGEIAVPFTANPCEQNIIIKSGNFAAFHKFSHLGENYALEATFHADREALIESAKAKIVVKPKLTLNSVPIDVKLLKETSLSITMVDRNGITTSKEINNPSLTNDGETEFEIKVPEKLEKLTFLLKGKIDSLILGKPSDLSATKELTFNAIDKTNQIEDLFLSKFENNYIVEVLGKTGEPKSERPVHFEFKHRDYLPTIKVTLQTDSKGRIDLGELQGISCIMANTQTGCSKTWNTIREKRFFTSCIQAVSGKPVFIPASEEIQTGTASSVWLFEVREGNYITDYSSNVKIKDGFIVIDDLPAGDFEIFSLAGMKTTILKLTEGKEESDYLISKTRFLKKEGDNPLQILAIEDSQKEKKLKIQLKNTTSETRIHIVADRFVPDRDLWDSLGAPCDDPFPTCDYWVMPTTRYVSGRSIGDEYQYILERKFAKIFPGNMLKRPSLLLTPFSLRKTETGTQAAEAGNAFSPLPEPSPQKSSEPMSPNGIALAQEKNQGFANFDFLATASKVFYNLKPNSDEALFINLEDLGDRQHVQIYVTDGRDAIFKTISLSEKNCPTKDLRLAQMLDQSKHFSEMKKITGLASGTNLTLDDIRTARFEVFDSLERVHALFSSLKVDSNFAEFNFILKWPDLKPEEKKKLYSKYACHELNLFLYKKDPAFFESVIKPFLSDKHDKTFMDNYLIGADLSNYLKPWAYERLNIVEKILLTERITDQVSATERHVTDLYDLIPPDIEMYNQLFETALKSGSLDVGDKFGLDAAKQQFAAKPCAPPPPPMMMKTASLAGAPPKGAIADKEEISLQEVSTENEYKNAPCEPSNADAFAATNLDDSAAGKDSRSEEKALRKIAKPTARPGVGTKKMLSNRLRADRDSYEQDAKRRSEFRAFYRALEKTEEWAENNYYKLPIQNQVADLVKVNGFWKDFAARDRKVPFISKNVAEAAGNFTEMMLALAVLDLPFKSADHSVEFNNAAMKFGARTPCIIFHREIKPCENIEKTQTILTSQNFFAENDRYKYENHEKYDKFITDEFETNRVYGCQVTLTNPSSAKHKVDFLMQIPSGALPISNGFFTKSEHLQIEPYSTKLFEYYFYFPLSGAFDLYPVQVSENGKILAFGKSFKFKVVETPTTIDENSWEHVSQNAKDDVVLRFLLESNINRIDLNKIAFRMKSKEFFLKTLDLLSARKVYNETIWSYGIFHNHVPAIVECLRHSSFATSCGTTLKSELLSLDPVERMVYQHKEYQPLVNPRVYTLGKKRKILNQQFYAQYEEFLADLKFHPALLDHDKMEIAYYLLLQDRVEEALKFFDLVKDEKLVGTLQYKYLQTYFDFYLGKADEAAKIASKLTDYQVDRWRDLFRDVMAQVEETLGSAAKVINPEDRDQAVTKLADTEPVLDLAVDNGKIEIGYKNLKSVELNFYIMDIELLFSKNPFVQEISGQFSIIQPNETLSIELLPGQATNSVMIPEKLRDKNVMIEAVAGSVRKTKSYYPNTMDVQILENYGQLKVLSKTDGKPISKTYVKTFARMKDGQIAFYKDGYTDLRGRFDYSSLSTSELDNVEKFSILIISDKNGSLVREATPPKM